MDPVEALIREASVIERRLWAETQTYASRLEHVFATLLTYGEGHTVEAAAENIALGHAFAAMFLIQGVTGMPPVKGQDALEWVAAWKETHPGNWHQQVQKLSLDPALPRTYGSDIAGPLYAHALSLLRNRANVEELMQDMYLHFFQGEGQKIHGSFDSARKYVKNVIEWRAKSRAKRNRAERSLTKGPGEEDEGAERELVDESHGLDDLLQRARTDAKYKELWDIIFSDPKLKSEIERIHPDALSYLHMVSQGLSDVQILGMTARGEVVGDPMLQHAVSSNGSRLTPQAWGYQKQKIFKAILRHFAQHGEHEHEVREHMHLARAYDYDRG